MLVDSSILETFVTKILVERGEPEETAEQVATSLVKSDLRGHSSHGVIRLEKYLEMINDGRIEPGSQPIVKRETQVTANVDGNAAFGQIVGRKATNLAIEKARGSGVGVIGVRNANHLGRVGEWSEKATSEDLLFSAFVRGPGNLVAPAGTADRKLSTNPISFGVPTFDILDHPIILDMATSQVAHGKIRERSTTDQSLPEGWTISDDGSHIEDATDFVQGAGALLPLGGTTSGYKGFGLSITAELYATILGNKDVTEQRSGGMNNSAALVAIDPVTFSSEETIRTNIASLITHLRSANSSDDISPGIAAKGDDPLLPGEAEHERTINRLENGIPISKEVAINLRDLANRYGLESDVPDQLKLG